MGLHLCYELALPSESSREQVLEVLGRLRSWGERIEFDRITEIRQYEGEACEPGHRANSPIFDHPEFEHLEGKGQS